MEIFVIAVVLVLVIGILRQFIIPGARGRSESPASDHHHSSYQHLDLSTSGGGQESSGGHWGGHEASHGGDWGGADGGGDGGGSDGGGGGGGE